MKFTPTQISICALGTLATLAAGYGLSQGQSANPSPNLAQIDSEKPQTDPAQAAMLPDLRPPLAQPEILSPPPLAKLPSINGQRPMPMPAILSPVATPMIDRLRAANSAASSASAVASPAVASPELPSPALASSTRSILLSPPGSSAGEDRSQIAPQVTAPSPSSDQGHGPLRPQMGTPLAVTSASAPLPPALSTPERAFPSSASRQGPPLPSVVPQDGLATQTTQAAGGPSGTVVPSSRLTDDNLPQAPLPPSDLPATDLADAAPPAPSPASQPSDRPTAGIADATSAPPLPLSPSVEASQADGSVLAEFHTLESGDRLRIEILNFPEYNKDYQVLENGTVELNLAGSLNVQGLTRKQAEAAIASRYAKLLQRPVLDVRVLATRSLNAAISSAGRDSDVARAIAAAGPKFFHGVPGPQ